MTTSRRSFLRIAGLAAASTLAMPHHARAGRAASPLQRFVATLQPGAIARHGALTLVWLHGGEGAPLITVVTLDEAQASGELLITEHGSATVPELIVNNRGKAHVLMLAGEILVGGKQNRVLREDILLPPLSGPRPVSTPSPTPACSVASGASSCAPTCWNRTARRRPRRSVTTRRGSAPARSWARWPAPGARRVAMRASVSSSSSGARTFAARPSTMRGAWCTWRWRELRGDAGGRGGRDQFRGVQRGRHAA